ncbi:hypothetical protein GCM10010909_13370 [Acidocella aquatica]|uniref:Uncharacterized protein n=1 Tax=Acidocella aquatica TaxID=1922313 RepID=A0ABQ6A5U0_9PROT|nr:hypothetical protein [Acidocella aquatica]GLR66657.1 hypothetical protein GCM10010909_13370 [Acidocella aquatica]
MPHLLFPQIGRVLVAVQAGRRYIWFMRKISLLALAALTACSLPGRQTFAPTPLAADPASIAAANAFAGRIPLVSIAPGTADFAAPLSGAVRQALAIKPGAAFDVEAQAPAAATPGASAAALAPLTPLASAVAQSIAADGVAPDHIMLTARTGGTAPVILVYVK